MTKKSVERPDQGDQPSLAVLAAEARALRALVAELGRQLATLGRAEEAVPINVWLAKATPDEMLDRWQEIRGDQAEGFLFGRMKRRRAARGLPV
jgi:hypothetical protein